jgi:hypothetical protein
MLESVIGVSGVPASGVPSPVASTTAPAGYLIRGMPLPEVPAGERLWRMGTRVIVPGRPARIFAPSEIK